MGSTLLVTFAVVAFPSLKSDRNNSPQKYQYSWYVSAAFFSGPNAASLIVVAWLIIFMAIFTAVLYNHGEEKLNRVIVPKPSTIVADDDDKYTAQSVPCDNLNLVLVLPKRSRWSTLYDVSICTLGITSNCVIIVGVNMLYVYYRSATSKELTILWDIFMVIFRLAWYHIVVGKWINIITYYVKLSWLNKVWVISFLYIFSSISGPVLGTMLNDPSCFEEMVFPGDPIQQFYSFDYCINIDQSGNCVEYGTSVQSTTYQPPFVYNNNCSSAVLINYIHILIYSYCLLAVLPPLGFFIISRIPPDKIPLKMRKVLPGAMWPYESNKFPSLLRVQHMMANHVLHIVNMITFGFTSPCLAVLIAIVIYIDISIVDVIVGNFVHVHLTGSSVPDIADEFERLNSETRNVWRVLKKCLGLILGIALLFYTIFAIDIACDTVNIGEVIWIPLVCFLFPVSIWIARKGFIVYNVDSRLSSMLSWFRSGASSSIQKSINCVDDGQKSVSHVFSPRGSVNTVPSFPSTEATDSNNTPVENPLFEIPHYYLDSHIISENL